MLSFDISEIIAKYALSKPYKITNWIKPYIVVKEDTWKLEALTIANLASSNESFRHHNMACLDSKNNNIIDKCFEVLYSDDFQLNLHYEFPTISFGLCSNIDTEIVKTFENFKDKLNWSQICENISCMDLIEEDVYNNDCQNIDFNTLMYNSNSIDLIEELEMPYTDLLWYGLSSNKNAIHILENNKNNIDYVNLLLNPNAMELIEEFLEDNECCGTLSLNPNAIYLLEDKYFEQINWSLLSANPKAIKLLENNIDKIDWTTILLNPNALDIIKNNQDKIKNWLLIAKNPSILEIDYEKYYKFLKTTTKTIEKFRHYS
jgi:hypothetical protein